MTDVTASRSPGRARRWRLGALALAGGLLVAPLVGATPAGANPFVWNVTWSDGVTSAGPNSFTSVPVLRGRAAAPLDANPQRVDYSVATPAGYPAACAPGDGRAELSGKTFTVRAGFRCNGTYTVRVTPYDGLGWPAPDRARISAPVSIADPGAAPSGVTRTVDADARRVTLSWGRVGAPDVVGYRIRRDGQPVADVGPDATSHADVVAGPGTYTYDVQTLRWGAGGPGSGAVASPASSPQTAEIAPPPAPPPPVGGPGGGGDTGGSGGGAAEGRPGGSGSGGSGAPGGSGGPGGSGAEANDREGSSTTIAGRAPSGPSGSRDTFRSGGTIAPSTGPGGSSLSTGSGGPEAADTYDERLPYEPRQEGRVVELAGPDSTRTVATTVATPTRTGPGLVVPLAVVLVLVAGSLQIRALLARVADRPIAIETD